MIHSHVNYLAAIAAALAAMIAGFVRTGWKGTDFHDGGKTGLPKDQKRQTRLFLFRWREYEHGRRI